MVLFFDAYQQLHEVLLRMENGFIPVKGNALTFISILLPEQNLSSRPIHELYATLPTLKVRSCGNNQISF